ncbi:MAG: hypothetical protein KGL39_01525 [Patescibacteria group bacterium]|nr:hypothetical protein [Patescibacteria group bacterium]
MGRSWTAVAVLAILIAIVLLHRAATTLSSQSALDPDAPLLGDTPPPPGGSRSLVCADDSGPQPSIMTTTYPVAEQCVQNCPTNSEDCRMAYSGCIDKIVRDGIDLTSIYAPRLIAQCQEEAASCRQSFLDCANACGQLSIT